MVKKNKEIPKESSSESDVTCSVATEHNSEKVKEKVCVNLKNECGVEKESKKIKKIEKKVVKEEEKKKKSKKLLWDNEKYKLLKIEPPVKLGEETKKEYAVRITYCLKEDNKSKKNKTIRFGDKNRENYTCNKDEIKKLSYVNRLQNTQNIFHKNFWNLNLLYNKSSVLESYTDLLEKLCMM